MPDHIVYFAHGKESGPWGTKIQALAKIARDKGFHVESPDYSTMMDPDERVKKLLALKPSAGKNLVLVGSSMGGYVSALASAHLNVSGLFLLAPAFFIPGYAVQSPVPKAQLTYIVHGWEDNIVPVENSIRFSREHKSRLFLLPSDHRLVSVLTDVERFFCVFLENIFS
ncbi:MAG: alpha/beta hydrolase [Candidatus Omnitrophota bacterium]|nr:alpha/beta hydrolase [Candidatus Omnitrophota bacterium]MDZ4242492.1 alpha/beta hydrolase [Candidatus Omnitrophota bacterium]